VLFGVKQIAVHRAEKRNRTGFCHEHPKPFTGCDDLDAIAGFDAGGIIHRRDQEGLEVLPVMGDGVFELVVWPSVLGK
jgi:hypothetical protein